MRIVVLIGLISGIIFYTGCNKLDEYTIFTMSYSDTVQVESMIGINLPFNMYTPEISTDSESIFTVNDTRKDLVEEIHVNEVILKLDKPVNGDFSFLNSLKVYISSPNQDEKLIAWKDSIPNDVGKELILELSEDDFKNYLTEDQIILRINTLTDELIFSDHDILIDAEFEVNARILGI